MRLHAHIVDPEESDIIDDDTHPRTGSKSVDDRGIGSRLSYLIPDLHVSEEEEENDDDGEHGLPVMLIVFVCMLAVMGGVCVVFIHDAVLYSGCPLGINGCNMFRKGKEKYGFFLVKKIQETSLDAVPEWLYYVISCTVGATIVGVGLSLLAPPLAAQLKGGGTVQSLTAVASGQPIPITAACGRVLVSCLYLGSGGTLGMEGPCIQVCTSLATLAGQSLGIHTLQTMSLLASLGFSCGFAASFNAPLSGILFAMEELQHVVPHLSSSIICVILVAAACSTATVRLLHGNIALFAVDWEPEIIDSVSGLSLQKVFGNGGWMLAAFPIGIFCSGITFCLVMTVRFLHKKLVSLYAANWLSWRRAFILHGLLTGLIGAATFKLTGIRGVWGVGAESVQEALDNAEIGGFQFLFFAIGKLVALAVAISVRGPGDTLEPVLISGAFIGGMAGKILLWLNVGGEGVSPDLIMKPCVVFGMTGLFASCFRFPLTPIVIVMELTGSDCYALVLPTILTCFIANTTSNRICPPLLHEMMRQDGIDLHALAERTLAQSRGLDEGGLDLTGNKKAIQKEKERMKKQHEKERQKDAQLNGHGDDEMSRQTSNETPLSRQEVQRHDRRLGTSTSVASSLGQRLERSLTVTSGRDQARKRTGGRSRNNVRAHTNPRFGKARPHRQTSKDLNGDTGGFGRQTTPDSFDSMIIDLAHATNDQILAELDKRLGGALVPTRLVAGVSGVSFEEPSKEPNVASAEDMFESALTMEIHNACSKFALQEESDEE